MVNLLKMLRHPGDSLKWKTAQGFIAVLLGDVYANVLRLAGNLIMARLLYPEAFGLMLIVSLILTALNMLSDAGIKQAMIVNGEGKNENFLNTAWTLLCLRGALLTIISCLLAYPISVFYSEPILFELIIICSLAPLIRGFSSPHEATYDRAIKKTRIILLESTAQTIGLLSGIIWLLIEPSIWALAIQGVVSSLFFTGLSFKFFVGPKPKFLLDKSHTSEIMHFGKWILLSTALTFMGNQGDKVIISQLITTKELGLFSIAVALARIPELISSSICWKLLLPVYSELKKGSSEALKKRAMHVQLILFMVCGPIIFIMSVFGNDIINILYDDRYINAGWMLQVMAVGTIFSAYNETMVAMMIAHADTFRASMFQLARVILMIAALLLGGHYAGITGVIYAISIAPALFYLALTPNLKKYNISSKVELLTITLLLSGIFLSWHFAGWPGIHTN